MKKVLVVLVACCMTVSLAFSMGGSEGGNKPTTVKMFQLKVEIKDAIDAYAAAYSAAHPETPVKVETLGAAATMPELSKQNCNLGKCRIFSSLPDKVNTIFGKITLQI